MKIHSMLKTILISGAIASIFAMEPSAFAQDTVKIFNIPSQPLAQALAKFSEQADITIFASSALTAGKTSKILTGKYDTAMALENILRGSGLVAQTDHGGTIIIKRHEESAKSAAEKPRAQNSTMASTPMAEVIVTSQKRRQNLQNVAEAVTAISGKDFDVLNIRDPFDLSDKVPGMVFTNVQGYRRTIAIRGIGNQVPDNAATKPGVAYHIDGIFMSNDFALFQDLVDISRIEITRGPDGTLYGNSSSGGMVNVITRKPNFDNVEGFVDATIGSYATTRIRGTVNIPLTDKLAVKFVGSHRQHNGYTKNLAIPGHNLDDRNDDSLAVQLLWQPVENLTVNIAHYAFRQAINGPALKGGFDTVSADPRKVSHDTLESFNIDNSMTDMIIGWQTSVAHVKGLFSYQKYRMHRVLDADRSSLTANDPAPLPRIGIIDHVGELPIRQHVGTLKQRDRTYTAEIDVSSLKNDNPFSWIIGSFYMNTRIFSNTANFLDAGYTGKPVDTRTTSPSVFINPDVDYINADYRNFQSYALFGQASISLLDDRLKVTGGLRYTENNFNDVRCSLNCVVNGRKTARRPFSKRHNVTYKATISYKVKPDNLLYASVATGIKPAASNNGFATDTTGAGYFPEIFKPEKVTAFELGSKNVFLDGRLNLNVATFYYDINNYLFQSAGLRLTGKGVSGGTNLPKSKIYGIEIETRASLSDDFWVDANLSISGSDITKGRLAIDRAAQINATAGLTAPVSVGGAGLSPYGKLAPSLIKVIRSLAVDLTGNKLPKIPNVVVNLRLNYKRDLADWGSLIATVTYTYRGKYFARVFN
ncbi:MAG: TonB-dependent receptor, partial [Alphaproteobacteria bacterium]|nr:TonB-dependent receptor [Alphaproteobacteria bacterium]